MGWGGGGGGGGGMDKDSWVKKCREIVVERHWWEVDHKRLGMKLYNGILEC